MKIRLLPVLGILMIVFGAYSIFHDYQPSSKERHSVEIGPLSIGEVEKENQTSPAPLIIGILAIAAGLVLIFRIDKKA